MKKKIGIYIDYVLRAPNIKDALLTFLDFLLKKIESNDIIEQQVDFWGNELKNKEVLEFYINVFTKCEDETYLDTLNFNNLKELFYNEQHYEKFLNEASYILFATGERYIKELYDYFNLISQKFSITLIDLQKEKKQSKHTLHFLSKFFIVFNQLLIVNEKVDEKDYDYVFQNFDDNKDFDAEFVLKKLKELECKLNKM